jgi:protein-tyrosine phosphatase
VSAQFTILVVCLGNVCRSPVAERLLRLRFQELLGERASAVDVSSAGVRAMVGSPVHELSAAELVRLGGDPAGFAARQVTPALPGEADLVLTATSELRSRVLEEAPRALKRAFTIRELATLLRADLDEPVTGPADLVARAAARRGAVPVPDYGVPDPIGRSAEVHRQAAELLDADCAVIARRIADTVSATRADV